MTHPRPLIVASFSAEELSEFRRLARRSETFEILAGDVQRLQVLRTFRGGRLDAEAALGARRAEVAALSALACAAAPDRPSLRLKKALFASAEPQVDRSLAVMLAASLRVDAERLRRLPDPRAEGERPSSTRHPAPLPEIRDLALLAPASRRNRSPEPAER